jgi:Raf kinase inhibitor-like YbhB/YbcL family protein
MKFYSPVFQSQLPIPRKYSYDGSNISIPLAWGDLPQATQSIAIIMDDPDAPAGIWVHWVIYNIPANRSELPENQPKISQLVDGSLQGLNSSKRIGYEGPRPPSGTHRYFFKLFALNVTPTLNPGLNKAELLDAMQGHIIEQTEFFGTYTRK